MKKIDEMRKFIVGYPRWEEFNVVPLRGKFENDFSKVSVEWFQSATNVSQLALRFMGSSIVQLSTDPTYQTYVTGHKVVTRQANFALLVLQSSSTTAERADTSEFLLDFIEWVDEQNIAELTPVFGDVPEMERLWASNGVYLGDWEDEKTKNASVYQIQLHKMYSTTYAPTFK